MNENYWYINQSQKVGPKADLPSKVKNLVVGGGLKGLATLHSLAYTDGNSILVDSGMIAAGNSTKHSGIISPIVGNKDLTTLSYANIKLIQILLERELIEKVGRSRGHIFSPENKEAAKVLEGYGAVTVELNKTDLGGYYNFMRLPNALYIPSAMHVNPYKLCQSLAFEYSDYIYQNSRVTEVIEDKKLAVINKSEIIEYDNIIYCYRRHGVDMVGEDLEGYATELDNKVIFPELNLSGDDFWMVPMGSRIIGGGVPGNNFKKAILKKSRQNVEYSWKYSSSCHKDGMPIVDGKNGTYYNFGYGKNELNLCFLGGLVVADMIENGECLIPDVKLFKMGGRFSV